MTQHAVHASPTHLLVVLDVVGALLCLCKIDCFEAARALVSSTILPARRYGWRRKRLEHVLHAAHTAAGASRANFGGLVDLFRQQGFCIFIARCSTRCALDLSPL